MENLTYFILTRKISEAEDKCQLCNSPKNLQVHHRTYENLGSESLSDLTVLCSGCHQKHHDTIKDLLKKEIKREQKNLDFGIEYIKRKANSCSLCEADIDKEILDFQIEQGRKISFLISRYKNLDE